MAHRIAFMLKAWATQAGRAATESLDTYNMGLWDASEHAAKACESWLTHQTEGA